MVALIMTSSFRPQETRLRKLDPLVGTKVSVKNVSSNGYQMRQLQVKKYYGSVPIKVIDIIITRNIQRGSLRGTSLSIFQQEYHNVSTEKSPTVLAHE